MATENKASASGGIGFTGLLTILFVALKLTHVIAWSWWWVLSPLWITAAVVVFAVGSFAALMAVLNFRFKSRKSVLNCKRR